MIFCDSKWRLWLLLWLFVTFKKWAFICLNKSICDESVTFYDLCDSLWHILWHNFIKKSLRQWLHVTFPWHLWPSRDVWNQSENYNYVVWGKHKYCRTECNCQFDWRLECKLSFHPWYTWLLKYTMLSPYIKLHIASLYIVLSQSESRITHLIRIFSRFNFYLYHLIWILLHSRVLSFLWKKSKSHAAIW